MREIEFQPIDENCAGCLKIVDEGDFERCAAYIKPSIWWRDGMGCPLMTKNQMTISDITQMALKEGIFTKEGETFIYNGRKAAGNVSGLTKLVKSNKMIYADIKKRLGLTEDQGKVRVGQQKQRRGRR